MELLPANMFCAVICYFCKRIWLRWFMEFFFKLLCSRSYAFLLLVLFMLLARSGFTRSVFIFCLSCVWLNQIGVAALSVKIEALEKQVSADSVDRALVCVRQLAGQPSSTTDMLENWLHVGNRQSCPKHIVKFLGFLVDSQRCTFILPDDKKRKFAALRESILDKKSSSIKTSCSPDILQRDL